MAGELAWLLKLIEQNAEKAFIHWSDQSFCYGWLRRSIGEWRLRIRGAGVPPGAIVAMEADFSPSAIALFVTLIEHNCIIVPLTPSVEHHKPEFRSIAEVEWIFRLGENDASTIEAIPRRVDNPLLRQLRAEGEPGLVLFSSGSTGKSKAAIHSIPALLEKFKTRRASFTAISFLMMDHIGGVNTLFAALSNAATVVTAKNRNPEEVCRLIERYQVDLLPTTPTFLNLLIISEAWMRFDLTSLKRITYGTEVMPESTLKRLNEIFPGLQLQQTYGLSELGILQSKSRSSDSLWVRVGGAGFETSIRNGTLWIKAKSAMRGYLNAPSPFDQEGWFDTGDLVEVDGEFIRILGRKSEVINVGGQKVYPAEVESVLMRMANVQDVAVSATPNPITGNVVRARFNLLESEDPAAFRMRVRGYARERLPSYKVPVKIEISQIKTYGERFKKMRRAVD